MITQSTWNRDYEVVRAGVVALLQEEGTNPKGLENQIKAISEAYMVPLKAQWLKVSPKNVKTFLVKYQDSTQSTMVLLERWTTLSLIKAYRKVHLSPKTKKVLVGIDRYQEFILDVIGGKYLSTLVEKSTKVDNSKTNSFTNMFINKVDKPLDTKVSKTDKVATKVAKPKAKPLAKAKPKAKPKSKDLVNAFSQYDQDLGITRRVIPTKSGNGNWTEVFMNEYLKDRALVRVISDDKEFFGRFLYIRSSKVQKTQFFRIVTKSARFIDIPVNKIDCVLEFDPIQ
jgi:hypothetical protein